MAARKKQIQVDAVEITFDKNQILASAKYSNRRDLVDALLDENRKYTLTEIDQMIDQFMKGKVK